MNGEKIPSMVYADAHGSSPYFFDTGIKPISPGETVEVYLCAVPGTLTYPALEDLVGVSVNLHATNNTGNFWLRNYTLALDR